DSHEKRYAETGELPGTLREERSLPCPAARAARCGRRRPATHVMNRGHNRDAVFADAADRQCFLGLPASRSGGLMVARPLKRRATVRGRSATRPKDRATKKGRGDGPRQPN